MKAIVLAAGFATRMYPLTRDRAKPLLDVGGRPVIEWLALRLLEIPEVDELIVVANGRFHRDFEAWAREHDSDEAEYLMPDGAIDPTGDRPVRMRALLLRWRAAVGLDA